MRAHQATYPIATMCRLLGLSTSGYYAWTKRAWSLRSQSNALLLERIRVVHERSGGTYGARACMRSSITRAWRLAITEWRG